MPKLKRHTWFLMLVVISLIAAACGSDSDDTSTTTADAGADPIRIGVVAPSAENDLAFTQSMVDSLNRIKGERNIEVQLTDGTFNIDDAALAIRGYANDGFDLVIAHGSQFGGSVEEIAKQFPNTAFAWGTTRDTFSLPNVSAYTVQSDQGGYVMGTLAARMTESKVIGVVGPIEVGDAKLYVDGFVAGVAAEDPSVEVNVVYIESFSDVAAAAETAQGHVENGADILTGTAQMVTGATGVASENDVLWFGTQADQTTLGESIVVASQVYHWEIALRAILDNLDNGILGGQVLVATFADGGLEMSYNSGVTVDSADRERADEVEEALRDGSLSTGVG